MIKIKDKMKAIKKLPWTAIGVVLLLVALALLIVKNSTSKNQAMLPTGASIYFEGHYSIDGGEEWKEIKRDEHIPATEGDVILRGRFHMYSPDGTYFRAVSKGTTIAFFLDHINVKVYESGTKDYELYNENPAVGASGCGEIWLTYVLRGETEDPIEIVIHNPHNFGNETAIDSFLSGIALWTGADFEGDVLSRGTAQRNLGLAFFIGSVVLLGIALFSTLIHLSKSRLIWFFGFVALFAGAYLAYSAQGTYFWSEKIGVNTAVIGTSMMYYMLFVSAIISFFSDKTKKIVNPLVAALGFADAVFVILPCLSSLYFYDMWMVWAIVQSAVNLVLLGCLVRELISSDRRMCLVCGGMSLILIAFEIDVIATAIGIWKGGVISMYVFLTLFIAAMFVVLRIIPGNINAALKARQLEKERTELKAQLAESRISTMMSQIRPHFIYNTLGSIEQLCELDPAKAGALVHDFSKYLRGNFGELDNPKPISIFHEMEHVNHYVSIEKVRFPDMTFCFDMRSGDFNIPALTVQPIVENAIKHGLMKLSKGGTINVVSYETEDSYCVSVEDNGMGFDTEEVQDERKHVGLRNIRERLSSMVGGTLEIESEIGVGTKVLIIIPKEAKK